LLHLEADRETSNAGTRYSKVQITLDNATGYLIDNAVVELSAWSNNEMTIDTIHFNDVGYTMPHKKTLDAIFKADSLSVSFSSIKAASFNFCYSAIKESNYGNKADRWFCRE
jgi:hypothetical protein